MFSYVPSLNTRYSLEETSMASHLQGMTLTYPKKRAGWYTLEPPLNLCATLPKRPFISTVFYSNILYIVTYFCHNTSIIIVLNLLQSHYFFEFLSGDTGIRYAMSGDVIVDDETFLQFELAMACIANRECYSTFCSDIYITMIFLYTKCLICSTVKF